MKLTIILVTVLAVNANFPVQDTEDVRAAKAIFYKAFDAAKAGEHAALVSDVNASVPGYIEDAEDVKAAKAEFFKAFAAAEAGDNYLADTPEVAEAKKAFFAFYEKRKLCLSRIATGERRKRSNYCVYGEGRQNTRVLRNLYKQIQSEYRSFHRNGRIDIDSGLEEIAQRAGCVASHDDHAHLNKEALEKFGFKFGYTTNSDCSQTGHGVGYVITPIGNQYTTCGGKRVISSANHMPTYDKPANMWKYCACTNKHWASIMSRTKIGCSVTMGCDVETAYCVLGGKTTEVEFGSCSPVQEDDNRLEMGHSYNAKAYLDYGC